LSRRLHKLAVLLPAGETPPREFRLFVLGWNETENGRYLFDAQAASTVMAAAAAHGVDRMIDLEHLSLDPEARHYDPDARGWAKLELRADGSLWAVDVRWTDDGAARLLAKRQRYVSPAFMTTEDGRITKVINIAITALPATHQTPALIAASIMRLSLDPEKVKAILAALKEGDAESAMAICEALLVDAASGEAPAAEPAPEAPAPEAAAAPAPAEGEEEDEEDKPAEMAAAARIMRLSGKTSVAAAVDEIEAWRASHLELEAGRAKLAAEREALEGAERKAQIAELIKLGAETPATAWADPMAKTLKPCKRLASEPLAELRERVKALSAGRTESKNPKPAAKNTRTIAGAELSEDEIQRVTSRAKSNGMAPEVALENYVQIKARQSARVEN
jgi:phage I-like protein